MAVKEMIGEIEMSESDKLKAMFADCKEKISSETFMQIYNDHVTPGLLLKVHEKLDALELDINKICEEMISFESKSKLTVTK